ncbi:E3 ubiquitin-protein ligase TRIM71-like [Ruditapes philippinarum]|uniref:E3 ubiquitin-protein ligase TRIM71-like n=1 Tax=Ruditapes philippinarum TaxID=129788 RepID=UPI00295B0D41|nr:E3 ubiquitin-protein ligase TRIM71-like [Ruditapes philippinarum]
MAVPGKKATKQFTLSTTSICSEEDLKVYCQPCDRDGPRLPAHGYCTNCSEHLCETCFTFHRRHTLSRHHTLQDKTSMPQTMSPANPGQLDSFTKPCPKHNIEMIKFYCHDHSALICSVCVTLEHSATSCKVNYIPDISGETINSKEYQNILKAIIDLTERSDTTLKDKKKCFAESNKSLKDVLTDIKKFRTRINRRIDELERQVVEAAKVIQNDNSKNLTEIETVYGDLSKSLKSFSDDIKHFNTSKKANDLFIELKHAEQMIKHYDQSVAKLSESEVKTYTFQPNKAISSLFDKEKSIGILKGTALNLHTKSRQYSHKEKICIKTSRDNKSCLIAGMTFLAPDLLIITDYENIAIKIIDLSEKSVLVRQCLRLDNWNLTSSSKHEPSFQLRQNYLPLPGSKPWDVTLVSQNEIAVTLPLRQTIQFVSVSRKSLTKKHNLKVDGNCFGINCHKDRMVVSFSRPGKIQILLIDGTVLLTIRGENIFKNPLYITSNDNCIYVSDSEMKTVTKLNWHGEVKGKHVCTETPLGLSMTEDSSVFVCYSTNMIIEEILGDCTKGRVVVKDTRRSNALYWSTETCTLYTSTRSYKENDTEDNNYIHILKFL